MSYCEAFEKDININTESSHIKSAEHAEIEVIAKRRTSSQIKRIHISIQIFNK